MNPVAAEPPRVMIEPVKRLFIVGCPRSGTTWTALLLAQHP